MAIPKRDYVYDATMIEVIDGDTVQIELDLGCDSVIKPMRCRLSGINAKGKRTVEGKAAKALVEDLFPIGTPMRIETVKDKKEKYGRCRTLSSESRRIGKRPSRQCWFGSALQWCRESQ
jgi:endonuclease YncB( thermonuclease family)